MQGIPCDVCRVFPVTYAGYSLQIDIPPVWLNVYHISGIVIEVRYIVRYV